MTSIIEKTQGIMSQLESGEFMKGMEDHYADDAVNEEVTGARTEGKQAILEHERKTLEQVAAFHRATIHAVGGHETSPGNGVTFAEYELTVDMKDGSTFNPKQVQVMYWRDGLARHIKFYYDPSQL